MPQRSKSELVGRSGSATETLSSLHPRGSYKISLASTLGTTDYFQTPTLTARCDGHENLNLEYRRYSGQFR
jgi:hypothetical protein